MTQDNKEFFEQLERHPELLERMKKLLQIVDGEGDKAGLSHIKFSEK